MGRFRSLVLALFCLLSLSAFGQYTVTVTADAKTLLGTNDTSNVKLCLSLVDGAGQQVQNPRVINSGVIVSTETVCVAPDTNGHISTTAFANDQILPLGTMYVTEWYKNGLFKHGDQFLFNLADGTENLNSKASIMTTAIVAAPTGDSTYLQLTGGNGPLTGPLGTRTLTPTLNNTYDLGSPSSAWRDGWFGRCINANGSFCASSFSGSDIGAKANAGIAAAGTNGQVSIPVGNYSYSTTITLADGITLQGAGVGATVLTYTGTGTGIDFAFKSHTKLKDLTLINATSGTVLKVSGTHVSVDNVRLTGANSGKMLWITGDGATTQSNWVNISNVKIGDYDFTGIGLQVDHAVDVYVTSSPIYSATNGTAATNVLVETGVSGLYMQTVTTGFGANGLRVQHSTPGAGAYNQAPIYLFFDQFFADTTTGGDAIKFDSSLGSNVLDAHFTNSWAAAAGLNNAAVVTTSTANGIHVSGGNGINFQGRIRLNALNGALIDNANAKNVLIHDSYITGNNFSNNADGHGIYVSAASTNIGITNDLIGNVIDAGHQKYAIKVSAVAANEMRIEGNDLGTNDTGALNNSDTGNYWVWGNLPSASAVGNVVWGGLTMTGDTNMNNHGITGLSGLTPQTAGSMTLGTSALPFLGVQIGNAATNNISVSGTATAARTATLPDASGTFLLTDAAGPGKTASASGCATAASVGATCTTTVNWTAAFGDASYRVSCSGIGITSGIPLHGGITNKAAASVTFQTVAMTAAAAQYTTIDCTAVHN